MTIPDPRENENLEEIKKFWRDEGTRIGSGIGSNSTHFIDSGSTDISHSDPNCDDDINGDTPFSETGSFTNGWCDALNFGDGADGSGSDGGSSNNNNNNNNNNNG